MATLNLTIIAGSDDGSGHNSYWSTTANTGWWGNNGLQQAAFCRFKLTADLAGVTVTAATFTGYMQPLGAMTGDVVFDDQDNPAAPTSWSDLNGRALTTAKQRWDVPSGGAADYTSPDFTAVLQEIVDSYGPLNGEYVNLILHYGTYAQTNVRELNFFESSQTGPRLDITYTVAAQDVAPGLAQSLVAASDPVITTGAASIAPGLAQSLAVAYGPVVANLFIKVVVTTGTTTLTSPLTVNFAQPTQGNVMALYVYTTAASITTPTGWTRHIGLSTSGDMAAFYKVAGASEGTSVVVAISSDLASASLYYELSGVDNVFPIRASASEDTTGPVTARSSGTTDTTPKVGDYAQAILGEDGVNGLSYSNGFVYSLALTSPPPSTTMTATHKWLSLSGAVESTFSWGSATTARGLIVVWRVAETVAPDIAQTLTTAYDPVVATAAATIAPTLTQSLTTAIDPTVTTTVDVTPGLATNLATVYDPSITTGAVTVTPPLAQQLATTSDPSISTGVVTVTPGLAQNLTTATDPTITVSGVTVTPGLTSQPATAPNPTITTGVVTITPLTVTQLAAASDPVVTSTIDIAPGAAQALTAASSPAVTTTVDVTPGLAQNLVTASDPVITTDAVTVTPGLAQQLVTVSNPAISTGTVDITPGLVQSLIATNDPTIAVTGVTVTPNIAQTLATAYDPTVLPGSVNIGPALTQQLTAASDPAITTTINTEPGLAQQLATATNPTITTGPVSLYPGLTQQLTTTYNPTISALTVTWTEGTTTVTTIGGTTHTTHIGGNMTTATTEGTGKP